MKIINKQPIAFLKNLTKAYTEGIYSDTPANRKLGRVGMSYKEYAEKVKGKEEKESNKEDIEFDLIEAERGIYDLYPNPAELKSVSSYVKKISAKDSKSGGTEYKVFLEFKNGNKIDSKTERLNSQSEVKKWIKEKIEKEKIKKEIPSTIKELSEEQFNKILNKLGWDKNEIEGSSFEEKRDNFFKNKNEKDIKEIIDEGLKNERGEKGNFYTEKMKNPKRGYGGKGYRKTETSEKGNKKTWDKLENFSKEGSTEKKLWDLWYNFQKSGNPSKMSQMLGVLSNKFPDVGAWKQTTPNTGKAKITALNKNGDIIAEIDLSGNKVDLPSLQTFMDKCHNASKLEDRK